MKFIIWKTSDDNAKPCDRAVLIEEGRNSYGWITRTWGIEINSLEELMELVENSKDKRIVLFSSDEEEATPSIEIYDDYRE